MLKSEKAREALQDGLPYLLGAVNVIRQICKHEVDERVDMWPNLIEGQVEAELRELIDELADEAIGVLEKCLD